MVAEPGKKDKLSPPADVPRRAKLAPRAVLVYSGGMYACHFCGTVVENPREVYRSSSCPSCGKDLKICLNCRFYSPGAHWDCAESIDELVKDKDRSNFCTFFSFRAAQIASPGATPPSPDAKQQAKRKLDKLFGNDS
jgi:hypothetical protein